MSKPSQTDSAAGARDRSAASSERADGVSLEMYRLARRWTYRELAAAFGIPDISLCRRMAIGEYSIDAVQAERLVTLSHGEITLQALHRERLAWLRRHRPDRFRDKAGNGI